MSRAPARQISFADLELLRQGVCLEPLLQAISEFLDDHQAIIEQVRCDLVRGLRKPGSGRQGLTPQQVLRSFVLKRIKNWDYRELRERIADGMTLRQFTDFHCQPVPKHHAFHRDFNRLTPDTLRAINDLVVQAAVDLGLEDGSKLRVDTTVVETDIHHPTDNTLLWDVVRVITRSVGHLAEAINLRRFKGFCDRTRAARRRMQEIQRMTARQRQDRQIGAYRSLIGIAEEVVESAHVVLQNTSTARGKDMLADIAIANIRSEIAHYCDLGSRVINQARRRVLDGEQVANAEKIYSIFEPHTDLIKRGKVRTPIEFGHGKKAPEREAYENSAPFKQGQRFRAGIEGRISVLSRGRGMKRCLAEGIERFELWVAAAVLANNLMIIATLLTKRLSRRRRANK